MTRVEPGFVNQFTITPTEISSDANLKESLLPLERNCRFKDEIPNNMTLFKHYSMAACQFECMVAFR